jgi:tellurite resistance protein TerC
MLLFRTARKVVVGVIGGTVLLVGVVMIVGPGPAFIVIPIGLGILATEFVWARRLLNRIKSGAKSLAGNLKPNKKD